MAATAIGERTFRATGFYTPVVGDWQVSVQVDGSAPATFALPITAEAPDSPKAPTPDVRWTTWLAGIAETVLIALVLLGSFRISRRISATRVRFERSDTTPKAGLVKA